MANAGARDGTLDDLRGAIISPFCLEVVMLWCGEHVFGCVTLRWIEKVMWCGAAA